MSLDGTASARRKSVYLGSLVRSRSQKFRTDSADHGGALQGWVRVLAESGLRVWLRRWVRAADDSVTAFDSPREEESEHCTVRLPYTAILRVFKVSRALHDCVEMRDGGESTDFVVVMRDGHEPPEQRFRLPHAQDTLKWVEGIRSRAGINRSPTSPSRPVPVRTPARDHPEGGDMVEDEDEDEAEDEDGHGGSDPGRQQAEEKDAAVDRKGVEAVAANGDHEHMLEGTKRSQDHASHEAQELPQEPTRSNENGASAESSRARAASNASDGGDSSPRPTRQRRPTLGRASLIATTVMRARRSLMAPVSAQRKEEAERRAKEAAAEDHTQRNDAMASLLGSGALRDGSRSPPPAVKRTGRTWSRATSVTLESDSQTPSEHSRTTSDPESQNATVTQAAAPKTRFVPRKPDLPGPPGVPALVPVHQESSPPPPPSPTRHPPVPDSPPPPSPTRMATPDEAPPSPPEETEAPDSPPEGSSLILLPPAQADDAPSASCTLGNEAPAEDCADTPIEGAKPMVLLPQQWKPGQSSPSISPTPGTPRSESKSATRPRVLLPSPSNMPHRVGGEGAGFGPFSAIRRSPRAASGDRSTNSPTKTRTVDASRVLQDESGRVKKHGWAQKKRTGTIPVWQRRYLVLKGGVLGYGADEGIVADTPTGVLGALLLTQCQLSRQRRVLSLEGRGFAPVRLRLSSEEEAKDWATALASSMSGIDSESSGEAIVVDKEAQGETQSGDDEEERAPRNSTPEEKTKGSIDDVLLPVESIDTAGDGHALNAANNEPAAVTAPTEPGNDAVPSVWRSSGVSDAVSRDPASIPGGFVESSPVSTERLRARNLSQALSVDVQLDDTPPAEVSPKSIARQARLRRIRLQRTSSENAIAEGRACEANSGVLSVAGACDAAEADAEAEARALVAKIAAAQAKKASTQEASVRSAQAAQRRRMQRIRRVRERQGAVVDTFLSGRHAVAQSSPVREARNSMPSTLRKLPVSPMRATSQSTSEAQARGFSGPGEMLPSSERRALRFAGYALRRSTAARSALGSSRSTGEASTDSRESLSHGSPGRQRRGSLAGNLATALGAAAGSAIADSLHAWHGEQRRPGAEQPAPAQAHESAVGPFFTRKERTAISTLCALVERRRLLIPASRGNSLRTSLPNPSTIAHIHRVVRAHRLATSAVLWATAVESARADAITAVAAGHTAWGSVAVRSPSGSSRRSSTSNGDGRPVVSSRAALFVASRAAGVLCAWHPSSTGSGLVGGAQVQRGSSSRVFELTAAIDATSRITLTDSFGADLIDSALDAGWPTALMDALEPSDSDEDAKSEKEDDTHSLSSAGSLAAQSFPSAESGGTDHEYASGRRRGAEAEMQRARPGLTNVGLTSVGACGEGAPEARAAVLCQLASTGSPKSSPKSSPENAIHDSTATPREIGWAWTAALEHAASSAPVVSRNSPSGAALSRVTESLRHRPFVVAFLAIHSAASLVLGASSLEGDRSTRFPLLDKCSEKGDRTAITDMDWAAWVLGCGRREVRNAQNLRRQKARSQRDSNEHQSVPDAATLHSSTLSSVPTSIVVPANPGRWKSPSTVGMAGLSARTSKHGTRQQAGIGPRDSARACRMRRRRAERRRRRMRRKATMAAYRDEELVKWPHGAASSPMVSMKEGSPYASSEDSEARTSGGHVSDSSSSEATVRSTSSRSSSSGTDSDAHPLGLNAQPGVGTDWAMRVQRAEERLGCVAATVSLVSLHADNLSGAFPLPRECAIAPAHAIRALPNGSLPALASVAAQWLPGALSDVPSLPSLPSGFTSSGASSSSPRASEAVLELNGVFAAVAAVRTEAAWRARSSQSRALSSSRARRLPRALLRRRRRLRKRAPRAAPQPQQPVVVWKPGVDGGKTPIAYVPAQPMGAGLDEVVNERERRAELSDAMKSACAAVEKETFSRSLVSRSCGEVAEAFCTRALRPAADRLCEALLQNSDWEAADRAWRTGNRVRKAQNSKKHTPDVEDAFTLGFEGFFRVPPRQSGEDGRLWILASVDECRPGSGETESFSDTDSDPNDQSDHRETLSRHGASHSVDRLFMSQVAVPWPDGSGRPDPRHTNPTSPRPAVAGTGHMRGSDPLLQSEPALARAVATLTAVLDGIMSSGGAPSSAPDPSVAVVLAEVAGWSGRTCAANMAIDALLLPALVRAAESSTDRRSALSAVVSSKLLRVLFSTDSLDSIDRPVRILLVGIRSRVRRWALGMTEASATMHRPATAVVHAIARGETSLFFPGQLSGTPANATMSSVTSSSQSSEPSTSTRASPQPASALAVDLGWALAAPSRTESTEDDDVASMVHRSHVPPQLAHLHAHATSSRLSSLQTEKLDQSAPLHVQERAEARFSLVGAEIAALTALRDAISRLKSSDSSDEPANEVLAVSLPALRVLVAALWDTAGRASVPVSSVGDVATAAADWIRFSSCVPLDPGLRDVARACPDAAVARASPASAIARLEVASSSAASSPDASRIAASHSWSRVLSISKALGDVVSRVEQAAAQLPSEAGGQPKEVNDAVSVVLPVVRLALGNERIDELVHKALQSEEPLFGGHSGLSYGVPLSALTAARGIFELAARSADPALASGKNEGAVSAVLNDALSPSSVAASAQAVAALKEAEEEAEIGLALHQQARSRLSTCRAQREATEAVMLQRVSLAPAEFSALASGLLGIGTQATASHPTPAESEKILAIERTVGSASGQGSSSDVLDADVHWQGGGGMLRALISETRRDEGW